MKKMMYCLLSIILLNGCSVNSQVESENSEPFIKEENNNDQKPVNDLEEENKKVDLVKKIDESQDWFVILETEEVVMNEPIEEVHLNTDEMSCVEKWINEEEGNVFIREFPFLNMDSEDAKQFNVSYRNRKYDDPNEPIGTGEKKVKFYVMQNKEILSILIKMCDPELNSFSISTVNFDLIDGHKMTTTELLNKFDFYGQYFNFIQEKGFYPTCENDSTFNWHCKLFVEDEKLYTLVKKDEQGVEKIALLLEK